MRPARTSKNVIPRLTMMVSKSTDAVPKNQRRNNSMGAQTGFIKATQRKRSGISERGYTTGVAYMARFRANVTKFLKSRYLVVMDEIIIPIPVPMAASHKKIKGNSITCQDGTMGNPEKM